MVIRQANGALDTRLVPGGSCAEVADAMALIAALAIDPMASTRPIAKPTPSTPVAAREPTPPIRIRTAPPPTPRREMPPVPWRWAAHIGLAMSSTPTPWLGPGALVGGEVLSPWGSSVRLDAIWREGGSVSTAAGEADFRALYARLAVVPVRVRWSENGTVGPWLFGEAGQLSAAGSDTVNPKKVAVLWGAVGAGARLDWQPLGPLVFGASGGGLLPLTRDSFYFRPDVEAHRIDAVGWAACADIGLRLP